MVTLWASLAVRRHRRNELQPCLLTDEFRLSRPDLFGVDFGC
jgi:hypothetical protein